MLQTVCVCERVYGGGGGGAGTICPGKLSGYGAPVSSDGVAAHCRWVGRGGGGVLGAYWGGGGGVQTQCISERHLTPPPYTLFLSVPALCGKTGVDCFNFLDTRYKVCTGDRNSEKLRVITDNMCS